MTPTGTSSGQEAKESVAVGSGSEELTAVDVLRRLLEDDRFVPARGLETLEGSRVNGKGVAESRARHRDLPLVRRDPFGVVAELREPRERRAESDSDLQQAAGEA